MRFFRLGQHDDEGLERAKRADVEATERLRESKATALWARRALESNGFAEALILIMRGDT